MIILVCSWLRRAGNASQGVSIYFIVNKIVFKKSHYLLLLLLSRSSIQDATQLQAFSPCHWRLAHEGAWLLLYTQTLHGLTC